MALVKSHPWFPGINRQDSLAKGLVAYWPFWEGAGRKVMDTVDPGRRLGGTLTNMDPPTDWRADYLAFNGTNGEYVQVADNDLFTQPNGFSIWANAWMSDNNGVGTALAKDVVGDREWALQIDTTTAPDTVIFFVFDNTAGKYVGRKASGNLDYTAFYSILCTWDGGVTSASCKIYVNGAQADDVNYTNGNITALRNTAAPVWLGNRYNGNVPLTGGIKAAAFWNRVSTLDDTQLLYRNPDALITLHSEVYPTAVAPGGQPTMKRWQQVPGMHNYLRSAG